MQCKYKCPCGHRWQGFRIDPSTGKDLTLGGVGATLCPKCNNDKQIDWTNYEAYAVWYRKKIGDGGCGGKKG